MELQRKRTATMSDEKIVDLYWQRDEQAIKETDIKYKRFLLSLANNIVHDMCDSEECLNDTYIGAWNSIPPARPVLLQSFLATIIRRTAINCFNANKRQKRIVSEYTVSLSELEDFIADEGDMNAEMETKELAKLISDFLKNLPATERKIFILRYYYFYSLADISERFGFSQSKTASMLHRTRKKILAYLGKEGVL